MFVKYEKYLLKTSNLVIHEVVLFKLLKNVQSPLKPLIKMGMELSKASVRLRSSLKLFAGHIRDKGRATYVKGKVGERSHGLN